jgi:hypothetical protein
MYRKVMPIFDLRLRSSLNAFATDLTCLALKLCWIERNVHPEKRIEDSQVSLRTLLGITSIGVFKFVSLWLLREQSDEVV